MRAAKDRREEFNDPAREEDISRRNQTRLELWEKHLKDPTNCGLGRSPKVRGRSVLKLARACASRAATACDRVVSDLMLPLLEEVLWAYCGIVCACAQPLRSGMFQGDTGRMASSSSSFWRKSRWSSGS